MMKMQEFSFSSESQGALSVSGAMALAKSALEGITVKILGEVSELSNKPGYKAVYFTIKDESASLPCMMWNNRYSACGVELKVGALVELTGRFTLYAAKGRMNFDVFSITLAGEGNLRIKVANLAKALKAEGLMEPERKRSIPAFPEKIGLVTSPRGAAVHDVLRTLRRRFPLAEVFVAGVPVEGNGAPQALIEGLKTAEAAGVEVILLVRGGGSFEDLMPFNDEELAREIAKLSVPVVTGIGHEPDTSIADMVADLRASTPTAAAEAVSVSLDDISDRISVLARRMMSTEDSRLLQMRNSVALIASRYVFNEPWRLFENEARAIDDLSDRLASALPAFIQEYSARLKDIRTFLNTAVQHAVLPLEERVKRDKVRFCATIPAFKQRIESEIALNAARLEDLSPLGIVSRGYAIAQTDDGKIVSKVGQVEYGERLNVMVSDGIINCDVISAINEQVSLDALEGNHE